MPVMLILLLTVNMLCRCDNRPLILGDCTAFGLTISLKKTKVMYTPPPGLPYTESNILVNGSRLEVDDTFVYLGSALSRGGSLGVDMNYCNKQASQAFRKLEKRVWS